MDATSPDERTAEVHEWQRYYNMIPRGDSKLTMLYANGHTDMRPDEVARELLATDFLYKFTLYENLIQEFMRYVADKLRTRYSLSWSATWSITRFYAPIALKLMCLSSTGHFIPEFMPKGNEWV